MKKQRHGVVWSHGDGAASSGGRCRGSPEDCTTLSARAWCREWTRSDAGAAAGMERVAEERLILPLRAKGRRSRVL